jgi:nucleotide-binding universal stress UspA family protein
MKPFSKILVPVDFSEHTHDVIQAATEMARRFEASVSLVHVNEPLPYALPSGFLVYPMEQITSMLDACRGQLEQLESTLRAGGVMHTDSEVLSGVAASEIVRRASEGHYDLIVMGTHGHTGLMHALIGSVAERVVRKAHCPVLTVREAASKLSAKEA